MAVWLSVVFPVASVSSRSAQRQPQTPTIGTTPGLSSVVLRVPCLVGAVHVAPALLVSISVCVTTVLTVALLTTWPRLLPGVSIALRSVTFVPRLLLGALWLRCKDKVPAMTRVTEVTTVSSTGVTAVLPAVVSLLLRLLLELLLQWGAGPIGLPISGPYSARPLPVVLRFVLGVVARFLRLVLAEPLLSSRVNRRAARLSGVLRLDRCSDSVVLLFPAALLLARVIVPLSWFLVFVHEPL